MDFKELQAGVNDDGRRLDKILKQLLPNKKFSEICKAIRTGLIKVNGKKSSQESHIKQGDCIKIASFLFEKEAIEHSITAEEEMLLKNNTILKTDDFLIINKPYDWCAQGGEKDLSKIVSKLYKKEKKDFSISFTPGPLHRLDRKTTGILCFSQSLKAAQWFSSMIQNHSIKKIYIGLAQGRLDKKEKWIDNIENDDEDGNEKFHTVKINTDSMSSKKAITEATPLAYGKYKGIELTLIQYNIETGRKHQIRIQSAFHSHPLLGDSIYGGIKIKEECSHYLHAYQMIFPKDNPFGLAEKINASILTNFEKMLNITLIKWNGMLIL
ncbi:MAG: RluA family pseudouridine synthase [Treponema sp.]|nr:RluA family pseudouridine synthase [Treponema sp.]